MISVLDRLATEFRDVQRSAESVAQPFACLQWCREGGAGGGASAPGPGPVVGARAKLDFLLLFFDRKSVGDPGF